MKNGLLQSVKKHLINLPGWRTDRKIIVIESDDWGMIRMASKEAYEWFLENGYKVNDSIPNRYDSIESNEDLELLFEILSSVKDDRGNHPVITANNIVANPNFEKIRDSNFQEYFYEPFTQTLERYPGRDRVFELYKTGISQKLFYPQFHGREHLNVNRWMSGLNVGNKTLLDAFSQNMFTVHNSGMRSCWHANLDAFGKSAINKWGNNSEILQSGLDLFEELWGFRSLSFISPCYIWPVQLEALLFKNGIRYIQGTHVQKVSCSADDPTEKRKYHFQGQTNRLGQRYLVRNVFFEPAKKPSADSVSSALKQIERAFMYKKPAVICTHRYNYIGSLDASNRAKSLKKLSSLLHKVKQKWPEVEFMTSPKLGRLMENKYELQIN